MYHGSLARNWKVVCVQSISQRSLSSCESVIVYICVCIARCQFGGATFAVCVEYSLAQGLPTYYWITIARYCRFGPKHPCVLVVTTSVYQTGEPTPRLKEDRNEISRMIFYSLMLWFPINYYVCSPQGIILSKGRSGVFCFRKTIRKFQFYELSWTISCSLTFTEILCRNLKSWPTPRVGLCTWGVPGKESNKKICGFSQNWHGIV